MKNSICSRLTTGLVLLLAVIMVWRIGAGSAEANNMQSTRPTTVAVVDIIRVLNELDESQQLKMKIERLIAEAEAEIDNRGQRVREIADDLKVLQKGTPAYEEMRDDGIRAELELEAHSQAAQLLISKEKASDEFYLFNKISDAIERLAKRDGYDLILVDDRAREDLEVMNLNKAKIDRNRQQIASQRIMFADPMIDLTDALVRMMNNEYSK